MQDYPEILTVAQVADYLQICQKSVYKLVDEKKLIPFRVMNTYRFTKESVNKFVMSTSNNKESLNKEIINE